MIVGVGMLDLSSKADITPEGEEGSSLMFLMNFWLIGIGGLGIEVPLVNFIFALRIGLKLNTGASSSESIKIQW